MSKSLELEKIESNWKTYEKLCHRLSDSNINNLLETIAERLVMCPASDRLDKYSSHPGGLIEHSLSVAGVMRSINDVHNLNLFIPSIL